jgi:hypothetical protein
MDDLEENCMRARQEGKGCRKAQIIGMKRDEGQ